jgi:hypothetical protein
VGLGNRGSGGLWEVKAGEEKEFKKEGELKRRKTNDFNFKKTENVRNRN